MHPYSPTYAFTNTTIHLIYNHSSILKCHKKTTIYKTNKISTVISSETYDSRTSHEVNLSSCLKLVDCSFNHAVLTLFLTLLNRQGISLIGQINRVHLDIRHYRHDELYSSKFSFIKLFFDAILMY